MTCSTIQNHIFNLKAINVYLKRKKGFFSLAGSKKKLKKKKFLLYTIIQLLYPLCVVPI